MKKTSKLNGLYSSSKAADLLKISRYSLNKSIQRGYIKTVTIDGKKYISSSELSNFLESKEYTQIKKGTYDKRNQLNDLTGKEWLSETNSFFFQKGLGADSPDAEIEKQHPAPYSFQDIEKLILFFTKKGMDVLDPFGGVGSTAKACELTGRRCTSIELSEKWNSLAILRLEKEVGKNTSEKHKFINGDARDELKKMDNNIFDFVVTSPPYWGILNKQDQKVKKNRVANNLDTKYSNDSRDLGNVKDYKEFLSILCNDVFLHAARCLKPGKYMAIVVSDFRDKGDFISFHSDLIQKLNGSLTPDNYKIKLQGTKILLQNHKSLLPYGYPFSYVENIHHQYILIFRKEKL